MIWPCSWAGRASTPSPNGSSASACDSSTRSTGPSIPHALIALGNLAGALERLGRLDEAESLFRQCLEAQRRVMGPDHPRTLSTADQPRRTPSFPRRFDEAEAL